MGRESDALILSIDVGSRRRVTKCLEVATPTLPVSNPRGDAGCVKLGCRTATFAAERFRHSLRLCYRLRTPARKLEQHATGCSDAVGRLVGLGRKGCRTANTSGGKVGVAFLISACIEPPSSLAGWRIRALVATWQRVLPSSMWSGGMWRALRAESSVIVFSVTLAWVDLQEWRDPARGDELHWARMRCQSRHHRFVSEVRVSVCGNNL